MKIHLPKDSPIPPPPGETDIYSSIFHNSQTWTKCNIHQQVIDKWTEPSSSVKGKDTDTGTTGSPQGHHTTQKKRAGNPSSCASPPRRAAGGQASLWGQDQSTVPGSQQTDAGTRGNPWLCTECLDLQNFMESSTYDLTSTARKCALNQIEVASLKDQHFDKFLLGVKGKKRPREVGLTAWGARFGQTSTSSAPRIMMKFSLLAFGPSGPVGRGRGCGCRWDGQVAAAGATC